MVMAVICVPATIPQRLPRRIVRILLVTTGSSLLYPTKSMELVGPYESMSL